MKLQGEFKEESEQIDGKAGFHHSFSCWMEKGGEGGSNGGLASDLNEKLLREMESGLLELTQTL